MIESEVQQPVAKMAKCNLQQLCPTAPQPMLLHWHQLPLSCKKNPVIFQIRGGAFPLNSNSCTLWMAQFFQCRALPHFLPAAPQAVRFIPAGQASIINERATTHKGAFGSRGQNWLAEHARILGLPWPIWRRQNWFHFGIAYFWQFHCGSRFSGFPAGKCF